MITVIDCSYWQQGVNYPILAKNIDGVILRAAYGIWKDTMFDEHYQQFSMLGIPIGCYHYIIGNQLAEKQARVFADIVNQKKNEYADLEEFGGQAFPLEYWNDVEDTRPGTAINKNLVLEYHNRVEELLEEKMHVYSSASKWDTIMRSPALSSRKLWVANYGVSVPAMPKTGGWPTWWLWQYTSGERLPGYSGSLDANKFNGSTSQYYEWIEYSGIPPEPEDITYVIEMLGNLFLRDRPSGNKIPVGIDENGNPKYAVAYASSGPYHTRNMVSGWYEIEVDGIVGWISGLTKWTRVTIIEGDPEDPSPFLTLQEKVNKLWDAHPELHD
jgi:GH25 family lysozyme M1 (1,4-beta-N-acetylmuramidase)